MTFLAVAPLVGWTLLVLTLAAITVIFFLRIQHRQVLVSSHLLWERVLEKRRRRSWLEWLRRLISLLIALAIGGSLVLAFTEAEPGDSGPPRSITLVIDNGLTMGTRTSAGETRLQRAAGMALDMLSRGSGGDRFTITDRAGRVIVVADRDRTDVPAALAGLRPTVADLRVPAPDAGGETWLITDGVGMAAAPIGVRLLSAWEDADNVGVTGFAIRAMPTDAFVHQAFLEVGNFSATSKQVRIELRDEHGAQFRRTVDLEPGGLYRNTFDLTPLQGGPLQATVQADGDALPLDDSAWVYVPRLRGMSIGVVSAGPSTVVEVLGGQPHLELTRMSPQEYADWERSTGPAIVGGMALADPPMYDGLIFEGVAPATQPRQPALLLGPPPVDWLPAHLAFVEEPGAVTMERDGGLLANVDLHDLYVAATAIVDATDTRVLLQAGEVPLLLASSRGAGWAMTTFDLQQSDLTTRLAFPILLRNVLDAWRAEAPMLHAKPGLVSVPVADATITGDVEVTGVRTLDERTFFDADQPGLYFARVGRRILPIAVDVTSRDLSAVNRSILRDGGEPIGQPPPLRVWWPTLLLVALVLLVLEGLTYHRRVTV